MIKLTSKITAETKEQLIKELKDMLSFVKSELAMDVCGKECKKKICITHGGSSETGLESDWTLRRERK